MARGTTLVRLLDLYRAECSMSFNPAHNNQDRDRQVAHLQRVQEWLWSDFDWPLLRVERFIQPQEGQRYYEPPDDIDIDRIGHIEVFFEQAYVRLVPGIDAIHYTAYDSEDAVRQWPPRRWRLSEDEQIEIWPVPDQTVLADDTAGRLKIYGIRKLRPLVKDIDRADLDDRLITLFAAAEYLASKGDQGAQLKQQQANARYAKLRGQQSPRRKFSMFGIGDEPTPSRCCRVPFAMYTRTNS